MIMHSLQKHGFHTRILQTSVTNIAFYKMSPKVHVFIHDMLSGIII